MPRSHTKYLADMPNPHGQRGRNYPHVGLFSNGCRCPARWQHHTRGHRSLRTQPRGRSWLIGSLPDAETAEDAVEEVVGVHGANHFAELLQAESKR